jgi:hypothetical protein
MPQILRQFKEENANRVLRASTDKFSDVEIPQRQCLKRECLKALAMPGVRFLNASCRRPKLTRMRHPKLTRMRHPKLTRMRHPELVSGSVSGSVFVV